MSRIRVPWYDLPCISNGLSEASRFTNVLPDLFLKMMNRCPSEVPMTSAGTLPKPKPLPFGCSKESDEDGVDHYLSFYLRRDQWRGRDLGTINEFSGKKMTIMFFSRI